MKQNIYKIKFFFQKKIKQCIIFTKRVKSMFTNTAYQHDTDEVIINFSVPLTINSCGVYQVFSGPTVITERPHGRNDYQLLYINSGKAIFVFNGKEQIVEAGSIVLFQPKQPQLYYYDSAHKPIVYWIHFSGREADQILNHYNLFSKDKNIFHIGICQNLPSLFKQIITELQLLKEMYEEMIVYKFQEILLHINRSLMNISVKNDNISELISQAKIYFNENYNQNINVNNYANSINMTPCWFIKKFKEATGVTPIQYLLNIRLTTAKELLRSKKYNVSEVATAVGYENILYFSRIFTKHIGISPSKYKKS